MNQCSSHERCVVVYDPYWNMVPCPLCEALEKVEHLLDRVSTLEAEVEADAIEIASLEDRVVELERRESQPTVNISVSGG